MKGISLKWRWLLIRRIDKLWPLFLLVIIFCAHLADGRVHQGFRGKEGINLLARLLIAPVHPTDRPSNSVIRGLSPNCV